MGFLSETEGVDIKMKKDNIKIDSETINLISIGIDGIAYTKEKVISEIERCKAERRLILGGDVFLLKKDGIIITGDSWYITDEECLNNNIEESVNKTLKYVTEYKNREGTPMFLLTIK